MSNVQAALLGQMIMSKDVYFGANLPTEAFSGALRTIYSAIKRRREAGEEVDIVLLSGDLPHQTSEIAHLTSIVPSAANWKYYAGEVRKAWQSEQIRRIGIELQERCSEENVLEDAYERLSAVGDGEGAEIYDSRAMVHEYIDHLEERRNLRGQTPGLETGIEALDHCLLGFRPRMLYYVGARPTDGKTTLMLNFVASICRHGESVGFISMESSRKELMGRLFANVGSIDSRLLQAGTLEAREFANITNAADNIYKWGFFVCDRAYMTIQSIRSRAREMVVVHGVKALFVDYVQLVGQTDRQQNFRLHMNEVSKGLKQLARELNIAVVAAAQLGRPAEGRKPHLSDFKETGQIEQDADAAMLIWHDNEESWILVEKNRDGQKKAVPVYFEREKLRFAARAMGGGS